LTVCFTLSLAAAQLRVFPRTSVGGNLASGYEF